MSTNAHCAVRCVQPPPPPRALALIVWRTGGRREDGGEGILFSQKPTVLLSVFVQGGIRSSRSHLCAPKMSAVVTVGLFRFVQGVEGVWRWEGVA